MDPHAWTAYAAVTLLAMAVGEGVELSPDGLVELLGGREIDIAKGAPLTFDPESRQFLQPLYVVRAVEGHEWGPSLGQRVRVAELVDSIEPQREDGWSPCVP